MVLGNLFNSVCKIINIEKYSFIIFFLLSILITFLELFNIYVISSFINFILIEEGDSYQFGIFKYLNINEFNIVASITIITIVIRCFASYLIKSYEFFYVYRVLAKVTNNYFKNILSLDYKKVVDFKFSKLTNTLMHEISNLCFMYFSTININFFRNFNFGYTNYLYILL